MVGGIEESYAYGVAMDTYLADRVGFCNMMRRSKSITTTTTAAAAAMTTSEVMSEVVVEEEEERHLTTPEVQGRR